MCKVRDRKVRNEQDARGKLAQIVANARLDTRRQQELALCPCEARLSSSRRSSSSELSHNLGGYALSIIRIRTQLAGSAGAPAVQGTRSRQAASVAEA